VRDYLDCTITVVPEEVAIKHIENVWEEIAKGYRQNGYYLTVTAPEF
jgi:hypothetical protein